MAVSTASTCSITVNHKSGPSSAQGLYRSTRAAAVPGRGRSGQERRLGAGRSSSRAARREHCKCPSSFFKRLKGAQIRFHAARLYSWMRPRSPSRRSMAAVGRGRAWSLRADGSGGPRFSERCGLWLCSGRRRCGARVRGGTLQPWHDGIRVPLDGRENADVVRKRRELL